MTAEQVKTIFVKRYVLAISVIAILSTSMFFILHSALQQSESTAYIVNLSGKQRMLSQRIASLSQQYYWNTYYRPDPILRDSAKQQLKEAIVQMRKSNEALSSGRLNDEHTVELSSEIKAFYFGSVKLKERVEFYLGNAEHLLESDSADEKLIHLKNVVSVSNDLLLDLHAVVVQYQKEGDDKIDWISRLEWIAWIVTLIVLMLVVIFIFQPMAGKIRKLFQEIRWHEESLEQQVALRTLYLEQANLKLEKMASHDPLTGLKNRLYLERDLEAIQSHYNTNGLPYAVVMFDIDWFKKINDTYGHDVGDAVLRELSKVFRENLRAQDSVYRSGGEEFVVLLNRITQVQAIEKMDTLRQKIQDHRFEYLALNLHCTISGGLYHSDMDGNVNSSKILKLVDEALYAAKRNGRNQIVNVSELVNKKWESE